MKKKILIILIFKATFSFACLEAYQFKIFPVGMHNDTIVTIDIQVRRTSQVVGNRLLDLNLDSVDEWETMWILNAFISKYDNNQNIIEKESIGTTYSLKNTYLDSLQTIYQKGYDKITTQYADIKLFKPAYISFCDFQSTCNLISLSYDETKDQDYLINNNKKYGLKIIRDETYYGFNNSAFHPRNISEINISSTRLYKTEGFELMVLHLANGHKMKAVNEPDLPPKEYTPDWVFSNIKSAVYEEPVLHHGYGFDVFIIKKHN